MRPRLAALVACAGALVSVVLGGDPDDPFDCDLEPWDAWTDPKKAWCCDSSRQQQQLPAACPGIQEPLAPARQQEQRAPAGRPQQPGPPALPGAAAVPNVEWDPDYAATAGKPPPVLGDTPAREAEIVIASEGAASIDTDAEGGNGDAWWLTAVLAVLVALSVSLLAWLSLRLRDELGKGCRGLPSASLIPELPLSCASRPPRKEAAPADPLREQASTWSSWIPAYFADNDASAEGGRSAVF